MGYLYLFIACSLEFIYRIYPPFSNVFLSQQISIRYFQSQLISQATKILQSYSLKLIYRICQTISSIFLEQQISEQYFYETQRERNISTSGVKDGSEVKQTNGAPCLRPCMHVAVGLAIARRGLGEWHGFIEHTAGPIHMCISYTRCQTKLE